METPIGRRPASVTDKDFSTSFKTSFQATKVHELQQGHVLDNVCRGLSGIIGDVWNNRLRGMSEPRVRYSIDMNLVVTPSKNMPAVLLHT